MDEELVYRYEYPDGGGPYFTPDGVMREPPPSQIHIARDKYLYGCDSLKNLIDYAIRHDFKTDNMKIVVYTGEIIYKNKHTGEVRFKPKVRIK